MQPYLFDVHTHVQFAVFKDDYGAVIQRALDKNIWLVNVGTQKDTSAKAVEIAKEFPEGVYAAVGLHPIHTEKSYHDPQELGGEKGLVSREEDFDYEYYKKLAKDSKVVAIGECGLDYYRLGEGTKEKQKKALVKQIELAAELGKPLMIHCRSAFKDLLEVLVGNQSLLKISDPGVIHFFSGTLEEARKLLDLDFSFSFGGVITFVHDYDEVVKYIPLERIVLETDAPYVTPAPHRGKRNEPAYVEEVARKLAEIKSIGLETIASQTTANAKKVLRI